MKRRLLALGGAFAAGLVVWFFSVAAVHPKQKILHVYSWSGYFPEEEVARFENLYDLRVEISYFSSNEELYAKMIAGASGYDLVLPSDYMISRMRKRGMLLPLDKSKLPNLKNLAKDYQNPPYDPGLAYSVPYTAGNTGLLINTEKVKVQAEDVSWNLLLGTELGSGVKRLCLMI